jgi:1-acyl-sn-glycerol-3-phosphate acyltransferase
MNDSNKRLNRLFRIGIHGSFRVKIVGIENIPTEGPALLVSNHSSVLDSYLIGSLTDRLVIFMAKREYTEDPVLVKGDRLGNLKKRLKTYVFRKLLDGRSVPVNRDSPRDGLRAVNEMAEHLAAGRLCGMHPEGTRVPAGAVYRAKPGVMEVVQRATVLRRQQVGAGVELPAPVIPVIPIALIGTDKANPPGKRLPRFGRRIKVIIGEPMDLADTRLLKVSKSPRLSSAARRIIRGFDALRKEITGENASEATMRALMERIAELGGMPYVDITAEEAKQRVAKDPR